MRQICDYSMFFSLSRAPSSNHDVFVYWLVVALSSFVGFAILLVSSVTIRVYVGILSSYMTKLWPVNAGRILDKLPSVIVN